MKERTEHSGNDGFRKNNAKTTILLASAYPIVTKGMAHTIKSKMKCCKIVEAWDMDGVVKKVEQYCPQVTLIDISLKGIEGIEVLKRIKATGVRTRTIFTVAKAEPFYAMKLLRAGAAGYVSPESDGIDCLVNSIEQVLEGEDAVGQLVVARMLKLYQRDSKNKGITIAERLTKREFEIFRLMGQGFSIQKIASQLRIHDKTTYAHIKRIKRKFDIENNAELYHKAITWLQSTNAQNDYSVE